MGGVAAGPGGRLFAGERVALHIPGGPVEDRRQWNGGIALGEAEIALVVHFRGIDDFARVEQIFRVKQLLDVAEGVIDGFAKLPRHPLAAADAVAVFAGISAFVFTHQRGGQLGDFAHFLCAIPAHIENWPHVQRADTGVGVPGALGAVAVEHLGELVGVLGQVF